jgi:predicted Zn-dependent protease
MYYSENRIAAHEMGHALGFYGHIPASFISDSMMSQGQYGNISGLTTYDINHLVQIYNAFV